MKTIILIPYFGLLPPWFDYFLQSCASNPTFTWHIFTDDERSWTSPPNVKFTHLSLADFNSLATSNLELNIKIINPYKICDFRPAFGLIFNEYIKGYNFWGYSDLDLIYGNIDQFINDDVLKNNEIISVREEYITGHFALLKNSTRIKDLFKTSPSYCKIFKSTNKHFAFDERSNLFGRRLFNNSKFKWMKNAYSIVEKVSNKIRFKFHHPQRAKPYDMNQIVFSTERNKELKVYRRTMVRSDKWFCKRKISNWKIIWRDGQLFDTLNDQELLHFHMISSKHNKKFNSQPWKPNDAFKITNYGIYLE